MASHDKRIDAYIENSAEFARPILEHLRAVVHEACPDVEETMKWSFPYFTYHGMLCGMASFKQHCTFGFWKAKQMAELSGNPGTAMGDFGRIAQLKDLPAKATLKRLIKQAMAINDSPPPVAAAAKPRRSAKPELIAPDAFLEALAKNKKAKATFDAFSPSHRREYVEWILEAKREETVSKRIEESLRMLSEGKPRHWKYINC